MINILVTLNANYLPPLKVMLNSLFANNNETFSVYMIHSEIPEHEVAQLEQFVKRRGHQLTSVQVDSEFFSGAPVFRHYSKEMYYRLAAHLLLPEHLDRILYLDPDIVVINPIHDFYWMDFEDCLFVAAEHEYTVKFTRTINKLRLGTPNAKGYFNTGVLLMNLELIRKEVRLEDIYKFIEENRYKLILPDQDVLNALYWNKIKPVDSYRYNYDARYYELSKLLPNEKNKLEWIKKNTVFIHFCGKDKPWHKNYKGELGAFYREYETGVLA